MSTAVSDGSLRTISELTQNAGEGYSSEKSRRGKQKYWCNYCPYNIESTTKETIKRHIASKHANKANNSPLTQNGTKRYPEEANEEKRNGNKNVKIYGTQETNRIGKKIDKIEEGFKHIPQSTQNDNLNRMLRELERGIRKENNDNPNLEGKSRRNDRSTECKRERQG